MVENFTVAATDYFYAINRRFFSKVKYKDDIVNMPAPIREAFIFQKYLEDIPVYIAGTDLFAGWYGYPKGKEPKEILDFHKTEPNRFWVRYAKEHPRTIMDQKFAYVSNFYETGHNLMDCAWILSRGLGAYIADVEKRLAEVEPGSDEAIYLTAMKQSLAASEIFARRYADMAQEMAEKAEDEAEKERLLRIAKTCRKVPMNPPEDFYEAVQAIYFLYSLNCISDNAWVSVSFGSFDQYMYPYYLKSKENGCTDQEAEDLLVQLYAMLDCYEGMDCALSVGGVDDDGNDLTNELSYLIISAEKRSLKRAPILAARIHPKTPQKLMDALVDSKLFEIGQPSFYSEYGCLEAVRGKGLEEAEARKYQISTCMQMAIPGEMITASWGINTNMHLPLELAINGGKPFNGELPIPLTTEPKSEYKNLEEIYAQYKLYHRELFDLMNSWKKDDLQLRLEAPNPWLSAVSHGCIECGRDRYDGGSKYYDIIVQQFGFANAADAFGAIEKLVFEDKKYTIQELVTAAKHNYEGYEEVRKDILACPKYGTNNEGADEKARRVLSIITDICEENWEGNTRYISSLHTLNADVGKGSIIGATLDGRLAGEPVNKNAGPANEARTGGPTALIMSATRIDQKRLSGGQALDVHFGIRNMDNPDKKAKIAALIKTYLLNGGLQMQVNALSSETLKKACKEPEKYRNLIVRIGGHSRYFYELSDDVKQEFIERFSKEEQAAV